MSNPDILMLPMDYSTGVLNAMGSSLFPELRDELGPYLVDKTKLIENIVVKRRLTGHVDRVLRPRRCGKSTMLQMLNSFFSIPRNGDPEPRLLFNGLYIASKEDVCTEHMGKYPVIFCDFKDIGGENWDEMLLYFREIVSELYKSWQDCLLQSLDLPERTFFESILNKTATNVQLNWSLYKLSTFLAEKYHQKVIVLIDEYEAPINRAYDHGYFDKVNEFFGRGVLPPLLKGNRSLRYAVLAGITPTARFGGLNNIMMHALHTHNSPFAGMLMFTEPEVIRLMELAQSELQLADLKARYNSYMAAGEISVYNPVSVMCALEKFKIENFWGEFPLLNRQFPDEGLEVVTKLLTGEEIEFDLMADVTFGSSTLSKDATLTLLYYGGYLTMTANDTFKIPNPEVMTDWARWIIGDVGVWDNILKKCVEGPVSDFAAKWPNYMQQQLDPNVVAKTRGAVSRKTPETVYQVMFWGLMQSLRGKGWDIAFEPRAGAGYVDARLRNKKGMAVLIELKSSERPENIERDADKALKQIVEKNYRNPEGLPDIHILREYGIACYHLNSCVKGRYLELNGQNQWVEKDDPAKSVP